MQSFSEKTSAAELIHSFIRRVINEGELVASNEYVSDGYRYQAGAAKLTGPEQLKQLLSDYRLAYPDIQLEIQEQIEQGTKVMTRGKLSGSQHSPFQDLPASGRSVSIDVIISSTVIDGRITEEFELLDEFTMLQQLEVVT